MFKHVKENKKIIVYGLSFRKEPKRFLTMCNTKEQCWEHASNIFRYEKKEHFERWCDLKGFKPEDETSWRKYYFTCVSDSEKDEYIITELQFYWKDILAIMRMFAGCVPLGSSFDTPLEYARLNDLIESQEKYKKYEEALAEEEKIVEEEKRMGDA